MRSARCLPIFKSAIWRVSATVFVLGLLAFVVNTVGIWSLGGVSRWVRWFQDHRVYFLLWRIVLYGVTVYAWLPMRRRVLSGETDAGAGVRLIRAEVAAIVAVLLIEPMVLFQGP
jgi:hypothetical protein